MFKAQELLASGLSLSCLGSPSADLPRRQEPHVRVLMGGAPSCSVRSPTPQAHLCQRLAEEWWVLPPISEMVPNDLGLFCSLLLSNQLGCMMVEDGGG